MWAFIYLSSGLFTQLYVLKLDQNNQTANKSNIIVFICLLNRQEQSKAHDYRHLPAFASASPFF